jgi:hypothetical protein
MSSPGGWFGRKHVGAVVSALVASVSLLAPGLAQAQAGTLDQEQMWSRGALEVNPGQSAAQTFTAGISGELDKVVVYVIDLVNYYDPAQRSAPLTVEIQSVESGVPSGVVLASAAIPSPFYYGGAYVELTFASPATVHAGTPYAIVASTEDAASSWGWFRLPTDDPDFPFDDPYLRGEGLVASTGSPWQPAGGDFVFQTYVVEALATVAFLDPLTPSTGSGTVINVAKNGRVVPVNVQLFQDGAPVTDANAPGPVTISVTDLGRCGTEGTIDPVDAYAAGSSSSGKAFRYDPTAGAWVYNLDTRAMGLRSGNCYRLDVSVDGTQATNAWAILEPVR